MATLKELVQSLTHEQFMQFLDNANAAHAVLVESSNMRAMCVGDNAAPALLATLATTVNAIIGSGVSKIELLEFVDYLAGITQRAAHVPVERWRDEEPLS